MSHCDTKKTKFKTLRYQYIFSGICLAFHQSVYTNGESKQKTDNNTQNIDVRKQLPEEEDCIRVCDNDANMIICWQ